VEIARAREKKGLSQTALAKKIHTTQQVISDIERLKYPNMTLNTLLKITSALRIHIMLYKNILPMSNCKRLIMPVRQVYNH